jgi:protein-S-isoprenylcysteine O-methyltransferase Ste14
MIRKEWFRPKKLRVLLAWIGAPLLLIYSNVSDASFRWGVITMILGETIRFWSLGFMEKKGQKLAMSGPYAFTRNPLYWGNFFLGLGVVIIPANWVFIIIFLVGFSLIYIGTIRGEEKDLRALFGAPYEDYCKNVPRLFPRLTPYKAPESGSFEWQRIWKHHEYVTALGLVLVFCGVHLYDELVREKDTLASQAGLITVIVVIALVLIFERLFISNFKRMFSEGLPNLFLKKK